MNTNSQTKIKRKVIKGKKKDKPATSCVSTYLSDLKRLPVSTPADSIELFKEYSKGGINSARIKNKIVENNLRLVISMQKNSRMQICLSKI